MKKKFVIVLAAFAIIIFSFLISVTLSYFFSQKNANLNITLGELDFTANCEFAKNMQALPNSKVECDLSIINAKENGESENLIPFFMRFNINAQSGGFFVQISPIFNSENWFFNNNYYYYKSVINKNETVDICDTILIDKKTGNEVQNLPLEINIVFEAIQQNAAQDLWGEEIYNSLNA